MRSVILAWLIGEGIIVYRAVAKDHVAPMPGALLATSGLFVMLGILGEGAPQLAALLGFGFDIAAFMNLEVAGVHLGGAPAAATAAAPKAGAVTL